MILTPKESVDGDLKKTEFFCANCDHLVGLWAEDKDKIYIEFEKRGELFSMVPSFRTTGEMKNDDIDHDLSTEDKEDLK